MSRLTLWKSVCCGVALLSCLPALGDGVLVFAGRDPRWREAVDGFKEAYGSAGLADISKESDLTRRLAANPPKLIVAIGSEEVQAAAKRRGTIPLLYVVRDPASLELGGENVAGVSIDIPFKTQLQIFKALIPNLKTLGVIYKKGKSSEVLQNAVPVCKELNVDILPVPITSPEDMASAYALIEPLVDALLMVMVYEKSFSPPNTYDFLLKQTKERNLPFLSTDESLVKVGALCAVVTDYRELGRRCGELAKEFERSGKKLTQFSPPALPVHAVIKKSTAERFSSLIPRGMLESPTVLIP